MNVGYGPQTGRWPGVVSICATAKVLAHRACENPERESVYGLFEYFDCLWKCLAAFPAPLLREHDILSPGHQASLLVEDQRGEIDICPPARPFR
jgi:hypothetical protein